MYVVKSKEDREKLSDTASTGNFFETENFSYLNYLLEHRPSTEMSDDELEQFAPWSDAVQEACK